MISSDEEEELAALSEAIASVLAETCGRRAVHAFFDDQNELETDLWNVAAELGWFGIGLPERHGGLGLGAVGLDVLYRALGSALAPGGFTPTLAAAQWLSAVAAGPDENLVAETIAGRRAFAVPLAPGSEGLEMSGSGVSGQSSLMLGARNTNTAVCAVVADGRPALAVFEVDGRSVVFQPADIWDRTRTIGRLSLSGARPSALFDDGEAQATDALRSSLALAVAGDCAGAARAIAEQTVAYLKERSQFGRTLASMQALKHRSANLMTAVIQIEQALDQAVDPATQAGTNADMWTCLAKASASDRFQFVAEDCVQLHGGVGFTWEFDCHIFLKRALLNAEIAGTARRLKDRAARRFTEATLAGETTTELSW